MKIKDYVVNEREFIINKRKYYHMHPEASLKEYNTAKDIEQELDKFGIEHKRIGDTGILASIKGNKVSDKIIALRCDIDALNIQDAKDVPYRSKVDGVTHACGHDGHTASLLAAAKILNEKKAEFGGEIRFFFQQAEEIGQGARVFIKEGALDNVERILGYHVTPNLNVGEAAVVPGAIRASCDYFKVTVKGESAHVSTPHKGIDALYIGSQIVTNLQSIVSRHTDPLDTVVVGIGVMKAGTQYNAVASEAILEGTTRAYSIESRNKTNKLVTEISKNIASTYGADAEVEFLDYASPVINDKQVCLETVKVAERILERENIVTDGLKTLGADDFAEYLLKVPGAYIQVGTRNNQKPDTCSPLHGTCFDLDEEGLLAAVNILVDYALNYLKVE